MCCTTDRSQIINRSMHQNQCLCGCEGPMGGRSRFMSKKQRADLLSEYLENLQDEVIAVKEHIAELKKKR